MTKIDIDKILKFFDNYGRLCTTDCKDRSLHGCVDCEEVRPFIKQELTKIKNGEYVSRVEVDADKIIKIIDDTLGYEGIGTRFTDKEIEKITKALSSKIARTETEGGSRE